MLTVSLFIALLFLIGFIWAAKSGQYDDEYTPSVRILFDEEQKSTTNKDKDGSTEV